MNAAHLNDEINQFDSSLRKSYSPITGNASPFSITEPATKPRPSPVRGKNIRWPALHRAAF
jgi:hypothetical protein